MTRIIIDRTTAFLAESSLQNRSSVPLDTATFARLFKQEDTSRRDRPVLNTPSQRFYYKLKKVRRHY